MYEIVHGCDRYVWWQFWFGVGIAAVGWMIQFVKERDRRLEMYKAIGFIAPLLIVMMMVGLECQNQQLLFFNLYSLSYLFVIVRD